MTVRTSIATLLTALAVFVKPVAAGPVEDANAAYERGDYATALELLRHLPSRV
jgi:hypothetical protein